MNTTKLILKLTAHTAGRKLTRADIRKLQMRIASLPSDKVNELMIFLTFIKRTLPYSSLLHELSLTDACK